MKILCLVSGGLNSAILYHYLKYGNNEVTPLLFKEPDTPILIEEIALQIYGNKLIKSDLGIDLDFKMGRMLSIAAAYADKNGYDSIAVGNSVTALDQSPDYKFPFLNAFSSAMYAGTKNNINLIYPFSELTKSEVINMAVKMQMDPEILAATWSCSLAEGIHCGECEACQCRIEAIADGDADDFTEYKVKPKDRYVSVDMQMLNEGGNTGNIFEV